jgi:hypothetical protein
MDKRADLRDLLGDLGTKLQSGAAGAGDKLDSMMSGMSDNQKQVLRNALIGGSAGLAGGGILGGDLSSALTAGALGATAGGAGTAGYNMLTGREKLQGEVPTINSYPEQLVESGMQQALQHPGVAGGLGVGALAAARGYPTSASYQTAAQDYIKNLAKGDTASQQAGADALEKLRNIQRSPGKMQQLSSILQSNLHTSADKSRAMGDILKGKGKSRLSGEVLEQLGTAIKPKGFGRAVGLPLAAGGGIGYLIDKYLKGDY